MTLEFIKNWFAGLPKHERDLPLVPLEETAYTPRAVLNEVQRGTKLGERLQRVVESGKFSPDKKAIAKTRLRELLKEAPEKPLIARYTLEEPRTFTPSELLEEIEKETDIGKEWIEEEKARMQELMG